MGATYTANGDASVLLSNGDFETANKTDFSLYTFDNDSIDASACTSTGCVDSWPPLLATDSDSATPPLSLVTRDDGNTQWALRGKALYFFSGDTAAGNINGEGVGGVWHTAVSEPVQPSTEALNANDGVYLVASGNVSATIPTSAGDNTAFSAQLSDLTGMSVYVFDNDDIDASNCFGGCLANWPALLAEAGDIAIEPYSIIERQMDESGTTAQQWAYHDKPLYLFAGDASPGDTNGKAISNWHLARPMATQVADSSRGSILAAAGLALKATSDNSEETTASVPSHGLSLYTFDADNAGSSTCSDSCLNNWPALMAEDGAEATAPYSLIARDSGELQWALNDMPLYFFAGDTAAGQVNGDDAGGTWHLARYAPIAVVDHDTAELILTAHGDIIDAAGSPTSSFDDFTVYTFDDDTATGLPTCFGGCAGIWPPLFAPADAKDFGDFTVVRRDDPSTAEVDDEFQWSYKGQPLYFVASDSAPGDVFGEYGTWHIARP